MAKVKNGSSAENEQNVAEINENLAMGLITENEAAQQIKTAAPEPEISDDEKLELLKSELHEAKKALNLANVEADFNETPETLACEGKVNAARKALNDFNKSLERKKLETDFNEKLTMAMADIKEKLNLTDERLNELLTNSKDVKDTLKTSFNIVFGAVPKFVAQGATSKSLTTPSQTASNGTASEGNVNNVVGDLFNAGLTHDEIVAAGHSEGRIRNVAYKLDFVKDKLTGKYAKRAR